MGVSNLLLETFPLASGHVASSVEELLGIISLEKGILRHRDGYRLILEIQPVNFRLKSPEEQTFILGIFGELFKLLKRPFQILTLALPADMNEHINYMFQRGNDESEVIRSAILSYLEFADNISAKQAVTRRFFLVIPAANSNSFEEARADLTEIRLRVQQTLRKCGNELIEVPDTNRTTLELLYYLLRRRKAIGEEPSNLNHLKQVIPTYVDDTNSNHLNIEGEYVSSILCTDFPYQVQAAWLSDIITCGEGIELSFMAFPLNKQETVRELTKQSGFSKARLEDAPNSVDSDITASVLDHALYIRRALAEGDDLWDMSIIIKVSAEDRETLKARMNQVETILTVQGIRYEAADYRQRQAWLATLPFVSISEELRKDTRRNVLASGLCSTYPFMSYEVSDPTGVLLGLNEHNGSPILLDIFNTKKYSNANMVILGSSGSGKTFATQLLASRFRLQGIPTMFICPLKGHEYKRLCENLGGNYVRIAPGSPQRINIMEIRLESLRNPRDSILAGKLQHLRTFFSIMLPDMTFKEQQLLDELLLATYESKGITLDNDTVYDTSLTEDGLIPTEPRLKEMPSLGDLYEVLAQRAVTELDLKEMEVKLRPYATGSLSVFNGATNVDLDNRYTVCDVSDMPHGQAITLAMFLILDIYRDRIQKDISQKKCLIIDEVWRLIGSGGNSMTADYVLEMYKTIRGYGGAVISATQDINDLFALDGGKYGRAMLNSAKIKLILPMEEHEARVLREVLGLTATEMGIVTHAERGHGLLYAGNSRITLHVRASEEEHKLITTDRSELEKLRKGGVI